MQAKERLWLTADKSKIVPEGHKDAATLYAAVGDEIPQTAADRYGIKDGAVSAATRAKEPAGKQAGGGKDKSGQKGEDKSGQKSEQKQDA